MSEIEKAAAAFRAARDAWAAAQDALNVATDAQEKAKAAERRAADDYSAALRILGAAAAEGGSAEKPVGVVRGAAPTAAGNDVAEFAVNRVKKAGDPPVDAQGRPMIYIIPREERPASGAMLGCGACREELACFYWNEPDGYVASYNCMTHGPRHMSWTPCPPVGAPGPAGEAEPRG